MCGKAINVSCVERIELTCHRRRGSNYGRRGQIKQAECITTHGITHGINDECVVSRYQIQKWVSPQLCRITLREITCVDDFAARTE